MNEVRVHEGLFLSSDTGEVDGTADFASSTSFVTGSDLSECNFSSLQWDWGSVGRRAAP